MVYGKAYVPANILLLCAYSDYSVYSVFYSSYSVYSVLYSTLSVLLINSANTFVYSVRSVRYSELLTLLYSVLVL